MANPLMNVTSESGPREYIYHAGAVAVQKNFESDAAAAGVTNVTAAVDLGGGALGTVSQQQAMGLQAPGVPATVSIILSLYLSIIDIILYIDTIYTTCDSEDQ